MLTSRRYRRYWSLKIRLSEYIW